MYVECQAVNKHRVDPVAARSKAWVWKGSLVGNVGSKTVGGMAVSFVSVVCCHAEVSASGPSLTQRSPTECVCVCVCVCLHKT